MDDLGRAFQHLQVLPVPEQLATLEGKVLARVAAERETAKLTAGPVLGVAAVVALGLGMAGAVLPGTPAQAATKSVFGYGESLAPSTLLANVG